VGADMEVTVKFYLYQLLAVGIIWLGMTFFLDEMADSGKMIYYAVSLWGVILIVLTIKKWFSDRKLKEDNK
jgi:uncharacterized membrane protein YadS